MTSDLAVIGDSGCDVRLVSPEIFDDKGSIFRRLRPLDSALVPVCGLNPNEYADTDDRKINDHGEPIMRCGMFADSPNNHGFPCRPSTAGQAVTRPLINRCGSQESCRSVFSGWKADILPP